MSVKVDPLPEKRDPPCDEDGHFWPPLWLYHLLCHGSWAMAMVLVFLQSTSVELTILSYLSVVAVVNFAATAIEVPRVRGHMRRQHRAFWAASVDEIRPVSFWLAMWKIGLASSILEQEEMRTCGPLRRFRAFVRICAVVTVEAYVGVAILVAARWA